MTGGGGNPKNSTDAKARDFSYGLTDTNDISCVFNKLRLILCHAKRFDYLV